MSLFSISNIQKSSGICVGGCHVTVTFYLMLISCILGLVAYLQKIFLNRFSISSAWKRWRTTVYVLVLSRFPVFGVPIHGIYAFEDVSSGFVCMHRLYTFVCRHSWSNVVFIWKTFKERTRRRQFRGSSLICSFVPSHHKTRCDKMKYSFLNPTMGKCSTHSRAHTHTLPRLPHQDERGVNGSIASGMSAHSPLHCSIVAAQHILGGKSIWGVSGSTTVQRQVAGLLIVFVLWKTSQSENVHPGAMFSSLVIGVEADKYLRNT